MRFCCLVALLLRLLVDPIPAQRAQFLKMLQLLQRVFSFVGYKLVKCWLFVERIFFMVFSSFAKKVVDEAFLIETANFEIVKVKDSRFYTKVANKGAIGFVEAWAKGWVEIKDVEQFVRNVVKQKSQKLDFGVSYKLFLEHLEYYVFYHPDNLSQTRPRFFEIEYDLMETIHGKDLHISMGPMTDCKVPEVAQINKMDEIARAIELRPGKVVMDIGCGWGATAKYMAEKYGASVIASTNSQKGFEAVQKRCLNLDVTGVFEDFNETVSPCDLDAAYSLLAIMYLRRSRQKLFFEQVAAALKPNGLFFLQTIGGLDKKHPIVSSLVNNIYEGSRRVQLSSLLEDAGGFFSVVWVQDVSKDGMLLERGWKEKFRQNRTVWEERMGKEFAALVEMSFVTTEIGLELREILVWNILLRKK